MPTLLTDVYCSISYMLWPTPTAGGEVEDGVDAVDAPRHRRAIADVADVQLHVRGRGTPGARRSRRAPAA